MDWREVVDAIATMAVRGAPAIGVAAAWGVVLASRAGENLDVAMSALRASRPTAVNLAWSLDRMQACLDRSSSLDPTELAAVAAAIEADDRRLTRRLVDHGVTLLPQELQGPHKRPRSHLPPCDVAPLVHEQRQVPVGLDPLRKHVVDHGLARRSHHKRLLEIFPASFGHQSQLRAEAFHVAGFLLDERVRNELRKVAVLVTCSLELPIQPRLDLQNHEKKVNDTHTHTHTRCSKKTK